MSKGRALIQCNGPWEPSGYGQQMELITRYMMKEDGWDIGWVPNWRSPRLIWRWHSPYYTPEQGSKGITIYPYNDSDNASDVIGVITEMFDADFILGLHDLFVVPENYHKSFDKKWACLFPLDSSPLSSEVIARLGDLDFPIVYSQFGANQMKEAGIDRFWYVPHMLDPEIFEEGDKGEARRVMGIPDGAFVISIVAANFGFRKGYYENLAAFKMFHDKHPEALLYLHTRINPPFNDTSQGYYFGDLLSQLNIPSSAVKMVPQDKYAMNLLSPLYMAQVHKATDILLASSYAEGFGLPIAQQQRVGGAVVSTDCTSMTELTVNGIATKPAQPHWRSSGTFDAVPSIENIYEALEEIFYWSPQKRSAMRRKGVKAMKRLDAPIVYKKYWVPLLETIMKSDTYTLLYERMAVRDKIYNPPAGTELKRANDWYNMNRVSIVKNMLSGLNRKFNVMMDIGCAEGLFTKELSGFSDHQVGIDISEARIKAAQEALPEATFAAGDISEITFDGNSNIELIICLEMIEHVKDPSDLLDKIHTGLAGDGVAIISTPNSLSMPPSGEEHLRAYSPDSFLDMLKGHGFEVVEMCGNVPHIFDQLLVNPRLLPEFVGKAAIWGTGERSFREGSQMFAMVKRAVVDDTD